MKYFLLLLSFFTVSCASRKEDKNSYRIYHMKYGSAYCGYMRWNNCGVMLSKCTDDKAYYCLQDVSEEVDK